jgi:hypothetical protein
MHRDKDSEDTIPETMMMTKEKRERRSSSI